MINDNVIPKSTEEAIKDKNWYEAMKTEYNSLVENDAWELVDNQEIKPIVTRKRLKRDLFTGNGSELKQLDIKNILKC